MFLVRGRVRIKIRFKVIRVRVEVTLKFITRAIVAGANVVHSNFYVLLILLCKILLITKALFWPIEGLKGTCSAVNRGKN